jgi:hypothetical protein
MESTSKLGADAVIDFLNASKTTESYRDVFYCHNEI